MDRGKGAHGAALYRLVLGRVALESASEIASPGLPGIGAMLGGPDVPRAIPLVVLARADEIIE